MKIPLLYLENGSLEKKIIKKLKRYLMKICFLPTLHADVPSYINDTCYNFSYPIFYMAL